LLVALIVVAALCVIVPKRDVTRPNFEFLPEAQMDEHVAYDSFSPNPNFADGLTLRTPPAGTVARDPASARAREDKSDSWKYLPLHYQATLDDAIRAGLELRNPFALSDAAHTDRGSLVYKNYCQVCHGPLGQGNGPITQAGFPPPASLLADRAVSMRDGQMFHVLTYGQQNMPSFAGRLSREDRWNAILYVRMLQEPFAPTSPSSSSPLDQVARIFHENCAACHGEDGSGSRLRKVWPLIPDFTSPAWQMSQSEMALVNQIQFGSQPLMPSFRYRLASDDILKLAVYVRSFAGHPGAIMPEASHLTARSVYGTYCFACHDTNGKGDPQIRPAMPELPDFTNAAWQKTRSDTDFAQSILSGKGKFMPVMSDKLGTVDIMEMVKLVRGFRSGKQQVPLENVKQFFVEKTAAVVPPVQIAGNKPEDKQPEIVDVPNVKVNLDKERAAAEAELAARIRVGSTIYQQYCFICHGEDGRGTKMRPVLPPIPDFTNAAWHKEHADSQLTISILDGKGSLMPANRGRVAQEQARDLVAFIRAFGPKTAITLPQVAAAAGDADFIARYNRLAGQWNALEKELQKIQGKK
jgi:mono/diheme cytochrome c family protein